MRIPTLFASLALLSACATPPPAALHPVGSFVSAACDGSCEKTAEITYLGVGGFLIRYGNDAILTAPFFSTPGLSEVGQMLRIRSDTARVNERMRALVPDPAVLRSVRAVLVGHSHYDHLMDVPHVAVRHADSAQVYGNDVMRRLLHYDSVRLFHRLVSAEPDAGDVRERGRWIYPHRDSTVRFMALRSKHAPHGLGFIKVFRNRQTKERPHEPPTAWAWSQGETLAYVIDFLDAKNGEPRFRIHYQDSASPYPHGAPPPLEEGSTRRYDVAILCGGSFQQVQGYPDSILARTQPRHAVLGHWENFFQPQTDPLKLVPFTDAVELARRIDAALPAGSERTTPRPGAKMRFCVCP